MPNCSSNESLVSLTKSQDLGEIAKSLWDGLLLQLKARKPKCKKGPKSWEIEVTKGDVLTVRESSRKAFWRKAQCCHAHGKLTWIGNSGSMLFWAALNLLMSGDHPRVKLEDNEILGRPNSHGDHFALNTHHQAMHHPLNFVHRSLHTVAATCDSDRAILVAGLSSIVLCVSS